MFKKSPIFKLSLQKTMLFIQNLHYFFIAGIRQKGLIMGTYINDCGKHVYLWYKGEWIDITDAMDNYIAELTSSDEIDDDEIPFCDMPCVDCDECADEDDELYYEPSMWGIPDVRRVVFNDPATIVFWEDNTKTVVKCMEGERFERYAGFAMACMKKMFGSTSRAKAIMNECDSDNKQKSVVETKPELKENQYEPKYKPLEYAPFVEAFNKLMHTLDKIDNKNIAEEKKDGTPAE